MKRYLAVLLVACSSSSSPATPPPADAGTDAPEPAGGGGDFVEPLPECIPTSIGIWDDFEGPADGGNFVSAQGGEIAFDPLHHCGAQGIKVTGGTGATAQTAFFDRAVPALATPTKAASWSFLVQFAAGTTGKFGFAALTMANQSTLSFELDQGQLSLLEHDAASTASEVHANLGALPPNEWIRIDVRIEYATKIATLKVGPPGGTAPTQDQTLVRELAAVTRETLGPSAPVTVHYDRAAVFVE